MSPRTPGRALVALTAGLLLTTLTACEAEDTSTSSKPDTVKSSIPTPPTQEQRDAARKAAGLPAEPKGADRQAFLSGLNAVDSDIVHGKDDKAISRGIDTCGIFKRFPDDKPEQIDQTNKRWSSPTHPEGHGLATAEKVLGLAHKHICPDF